MPGLEVKTHRFDVFAEAEPVGAKIDAFARRLGRVPVANLDPIREPVARAHGEIGKDRMARGEIVDDEVLLSGPEPAFIDFVGIAGTPVMGGW